MIRKLLGAAVAAALSMGGVVALAAPAEAVKCPRGYRCDTKTDRAWSYGNDGYDAIPGRTVKYVKAVDRPGGKNMTPNAKRKIKWVNYIVDMEDTGLLYCSGTLRNTEFDFNVYNNGNLWSPKNVTVDCDKSEALENQEQGGQEWNMKTKYYPRSPWFPQYSRWNPPNAYAWFKFDIIGWSNYVGKLTGWLQ